MAVARKERLADARGQHARRSGDVSRQGQPAHDAGDRVLQVTASRLRGTMRTPDFVAHLGGDEFVVVLPETATI